MNYSSYNSAGRIVAAAFIAIFFAVMSHADICGNVTHPNISINATDYGLVPSQYVAVCQITSQGIGSGFIEGDLTLTSDVLWVMSGAVQLGLSITGGAQNPIANPTGTDAVVLTIEAGTTIVGDFDPANGLGDLDYLIVNRGSNIIANGNETNPIRFTSRQAITGEVQAAGQWGGIIINGYAPINHCSSGSIVSDCESNAPFSGGQFGGNDDADSSGELRYIRIENAGFELSSNNGFSGLSLNGIGSNTLIESVQVHNAGANGIEITGGAVKLDQVILTDNLGTALAWQNGWTGVAEQLLVIVPVSGNAALKGLNHSNESALPQSSPVIVNSTIITASAQTSVQLGQGTAVEIFTQIVAASSGSCYSHDVIDANEVAISHSRVDCNSVGISQVETDWFSAGQFNNVSADVDLNGYINGQSLSGAITIGLPSRAHVDHAGHIGAVGYCNDDWTQGWSVSLPDIDTDLCVDRALQVPISNAVSLLLLPIFATLYRNTNKFAK